MSRFIVRRVSRHYGGLVALFACPVVVLVVLLSGPRVDPRLFSPTLHLVIVTAIAAAATIVAIVAAHAARHTATHAGPVLLASGCLGLGVIMTGHGLVTPGVLGQPVNAWVSRLPWVALVVFTLALAAAALPPTRAHAAVARRPTEVLVVTTLVLAGPTTFVVLTPGAVANVTPGWEDTLRWILAATMIAVLVPVSVTHWRRWRLGSDIVQLSLAVGASMVVAAISALRLGELWNVSWWDYHGYLLAGFGGTLVAIVVSSRRSRRVTETLASAFEADPMIHITSGYPEALRSLVRAVEMKDPYTHGHSRRTAELATRLGTRLRLDPDALRTLARGAYLHDVGKIGIAESILNKPGILDADERREIERHPVIGAEMVRSAPSLAETIDIIAHHHERWDGAGYPDGLAGVDIPFLARVTTVADVWDALTTDRSYRCGWAPADALAHIVAGRATHFDPAVVAALGDIAYTEFGVRGGPAIGEIAIAMQAVDTCHELDAVS